MKKIKFKLKIILKPKCATPTPPIGPILGQYGINLLEFCKKFNEITKNIDLELIHTKIIVFLNNTYEILLGNFPLTNYIKNFKKIEKFSKKPGKLNEITFCVKEIDQISLNRNKFEKKKISSIRKMIVGTLISIGSKYE